MKFEELENKPEYEKLQPNILQFWRENNIFEKSVSERDGEEVVFYDGPPFPTGKPHHGTVLVSFIKDMIARYWTMRGYKVPRVWGWDCHGLPIENQAETQMGIIDKNEIEKSIGIDKFNDKCYEIVSNNNEAWKEYVEQMARWVNYEGAYKTMNVDYMESVMWAFKQCYDKGYIYRDYRVAPYCMHCETSLSISDTRESDSTRLRQDRWIIAKFDSRKELKGKKIFFLAWTTTPWTLPSNMCLAVGEKLEYAFVEIEDEIYIACIDTLVKYPKVFGEIPNIIKTCTGEELLDWTYEPLFAYFSEMKKEGAFKIVAADYVGAQEGVGIVHTAPAFGEDDYWTCKKNNIPFVNPVDEKGRFTKEITDFYTVDNEKNVIEMNPLVIRHLYEKNKAVADGTIEHNYPHCWRCKRPLIYKAMDAWYFNIEKIKSQLIESNDSIHWIPETVKHGRFGNWLANARDWNISRNRYWSTPIPIWECDVCKERKVLGSIEEIYQYSGVKLNNLHRQYMDKVTFPCTCCEGTMRRVPEVLDCWFESGSVPFAQKHYPFENKEWFESHFPCDFIVEYTGQIRCWFYYLHVLGVALFDKPAFKNCIVHGTILAGDGKKLSKSSKNYTDPMKLMKSYGTDAFRLYLYQTNAMLIGDLLFDKSGIQEAYQQILLPYWNACNFYISYANIDQIKPDTVTEPKANEQLDKWILAKLYRTVANITENMDQYQVNRYVEELASLVDGLTNWYIRRSRRRFWSNGMSSDKKEGYETLYYVLVNIAKLFAPVAPLMAEKIYKTLTSDLSVHLADWPTIPDYFKNDELLEQVDITQKVIYLSRTIRSKNRIKNRQPLSELKIVMSNNEYNSIIDQFKDIIAEELNVKKITILDNMGDVATLKYAPNFNEIRGRYPDRLPNIIQTIKTGNFTLKNDKAILNMNNQSEEFDAEIILVTVQAKDGQHMVSDSGIVVSLDLEITEELKREGIARDVIRNVQDARKQLGCDIMDYIVIELSDSFPKEWTEYLCNETMSYLGVVTTPATTFVIADNAEDISVKIELMK